MRNIFTIITLISLLSSPSWSETIEDLVERGGLYYKKFTETPFTGEISGKENGKFNKGKKEGRWVYYHENGQLKKRVNYKNGKWEDGKLIAHTGDCYFQIVEWDQNGKVSAQSIHQYGSAVNDKNSKFYNNQSPLFSSKKMKPVWMDLEDIKLNLHSQYTISSD